MYNTVDAIIVCTIGCIMYEQKVVVCVPQCPVACNFSNDYLNVVNYTEFILV